MQILPYSLISHSNILEVAYFDRRSRSQSWMVSGLQDWVGLCIVCSLALVAVGPLVAFLSIFAECKMIWNTRHTMSRPTHFYFMNDRKRERCHTSNFQSKDYTVVFVFLCTEILSWPVQSYLAEKPSISCCMHVGRAPARFIPLSKIEISLSSAN